MDGEYEMESSDPLNTLAVTELEEGEVIQNAEVVCVGQEDIDRLQAEEEEAERNYSTSVEESGKLKRSSLCKFHIVSCQDELETLRVQNAMEGISVDPKEKLHFVKYVKIDGKIIKVWECGICAKDFRHQYTLMRHLPTHTDERNYVCEFCNKAFRQMSTLSQHRAIHSDARPYVCEVCQKTFNRVSTLISHRRTHFEDKPHKCHVCGKGFHQKGNLKNHMFSHSNERPYRCELCGRGFNQMSNLVVHKLKAHGQTSPAANEGTKKRTSHLDKFCCKLCGERFPKKANLSAHEEQKHNLYRSKTSYRKTKNAAKSPVPADSEANKSVPKTAQSRFEDEIASGLLIDAIETSGMQEARSTNQTAFALLKSIDGAPSLVKIVDLPNNKQLLLPATSDDLARSGSSAKSSQVKVAVVATVSQQVDDDGQLVVRIASLEVDQRALDSVETGSQGQADEAGAQIRVESREDNEQVTFVRALPDGNFEIVDQEVESNFLEIVNDDDTNHVNEESADCNGSDISATDSSQIVITQDDDGHLMVEGTPLQSWFMDNQQLQFIVNKKN